MRKGCGTAVTTFSAARRRVRPLQFQGWRHVKRVVSMIMSSGQ